MADLHLAAGAFASHPLRVTIGESVTIVGPMGSGKSTIGHMLALALYGYDMRGQPWAYGPGDVQLDGDGIRPALAVRVTSSEDGGRIVDRLVDVRGTMTPGSTVRIHGALGPLWAAVEGAPRVAPGLYLLSPHLWLAWLADAEGQRRTLRMLEAMLPGPTAADMLAPELAGMTLRDAEAAAKAARAKETRADAAATQARASLASAPVPVELEPVDATAERDAYRAEVDAWTARVHAVDMWRSGCQIHAAQRGSRDRAAQTLASVPCEAGWVMVGDDPVDCAACPLIQQARTTAAAPVPDDPPEPPAPGPRPVEPDTIARAAAYAASLERRQTRERLQAQVAAAEAALVAASAAARRAEADLVEVREAPGKALARKLEGLPLQLGLELVVEGEGVRLLRWERDILACSTGEQVHAGVQLRHALRLAMGVPSAHLVVDSAQDMGPGWPDDLPRTCIALRTEGAELEVFNG